MVGPEHTQLMCRRRAGLIVIAATEYYPYAAAMLDR